MPATKTKKSSSQTKTGQRPKIFIDYYGLQLFKQKPENRYPGDYDPNFYCSHCKWLIGKNDKFLRKEFPGYGWALVHKECFDDPHFKVKIENLKNQINETDKV